ncbi:MAG: hypothetical protein U1E89_03695 [Burkholderiaceae bacterium]
MGYDLLVSCMSPPTGDCADNILNYADKGLWNPNTREIHYIGQGHGGRELKFITYNDASGKWTREAKPEWDCSPAQGCYSLVHGYEATTLDPATGNIYARKFNSTAVYKWTRSSKTWTQLPAAPNPAVAVALQYFPEMGGVVLVGGGEVHFYSESQAKWTTLATGLAMGPYHNVASYNALYKAVILGGGNDSSSLYKLTSSGALGVIAAAPAAVAVGTSLFTVDPASGKHLLFSVSGGFFEYDVVSNRWNTLSTSGVPILRSGSYAVDDRVAIAISTYGLIAFLVFDGSDSTKMYLYRHAPGGSAAPPDTTPPSVPKGLTVQ